MSAGSNSGRAVVPLRYRRQPPEVGVIDDYVVMSQEVRPCNEIDSHKDGASAQDSKEPVNVDVATEIALAKLSEVPVKLSAKAVRATGRSTPSMRAGKGKFDRTFNDSGTSLPYKLDTSRNQSQVYKFVGNTYAAAYLTSSTTIEVDMAGATTLSELGNASTFSGLFDQYMIELIEIWLMPRTSTQIGVTGYTGLLCSVVDYDDDATITQTQALEYGNVLCSHGVDGHYRRYVPHCALAAYSGAFTSYANVAHQWIDVASTGVKHYGHKFTISVTDAPYTFDILKRVHVKFRNVR